MMETMQVVSQPCVLRHVERSRLMACHSQEVDRLSSHVETIDPSSATVYAGIAVLKLVDGLL
jgi:hypothetical protein